MADLDHWDDMSWGRLCIGYATTSAGAVQLYKASILVMAGSYVIWLLLPGYVWLVVFATILGVAYGVRIALVAPVLIASSAAAALVHFSVPFSRQRVLLG